MSDPVVSEPQIAPARSYTEATHVAYTDVDNADLIEAGPRKFHPRRITVVYNWRTQMGDIGWQFGNIEISGPWYVPEGGRPAEGSGRVLLGMHNAPEWARQFARANKPTASLVMGQEA